MLGATVMFAISSALSKWQVAEYSFVEVLFFRAVASLGTCAALDPAAHRFARFTHKTLARPFRPQCDAGNGAKPYHHRLRIDAARRRRRHQFFLAAVRHIVCRAVAEGKGRACARGLALVAGFLGVLLVAAPGADSFRLGALFALANAVLFGSVTAAVRGMTTTESAETLTMYQMMFLTLFFALALPFFFTWPAPTDAAAMIGNGVINARRTILVDARAIAGAAGGRRAVLLFLAGLVGGTRLRILGRCADTGAASRLGRRRRLRPVPALARNGEKASALPTMNPRERR